MRIFYICYENLSLQRASTTHIKEVTEHLRKTGIDVILFAPNIGKYKTETTVHTVYIPTLKVRFIKEYIYYVCLFFYLFAYQIKLKSDIFYVREMGLSIVPALIGLIFQIPHILEINGIPSVDLQNIGIDRIRPKISGFFQYINFALAKKVVCVSENIKEALLHAHRNTNKITVIENGVNADIFYPKDKKEARRLLRFEQHCHYLIFVGSFYPHHGISHIISIFKHVIQRFPNVRLIMVGTGYLLGSAIGLAKKLGLTSHIDFAGEIAYEKVPDYINAADAGIFILTGIGKINGRSALKLYEYLACGRPVITDESHGDFVRKNGIGIVISEEDYEHSANTVIQLLKDDVLINSTEKNGRKLVVNSFTWEITTKKILDVCRTI